MDTSIKVEEFQNTKFLEIFSIIFFSMLLELLWVEAEESQFYWKEPSNLNTYFHKYIAQLPNRKSSVWSGHCCCWILPIMHLLETKLGEIEDRWYHPWGTTTGCIF